MTATLAVGSASAVPGELATGEIDGIELPTGQRIDIPVLAMNGAKDGPTLLLFATQHGPEVQGIGVVHEVMRERLDPSEVHGAVVGVPVGNPLAYMHATYRSWIDNRDVGAVSAERPDGNPTERLAAALWDEAWSRADLVLNYHATLRKENLCFMLTKPTPETEDAIVRGARAFGVTTIQQDRESLQLGDDLGVTDAPTLRNKAAAAGVPEWIPEFTDGRAIDAENLRVGVDGTLNLMREFDLLDGEPREGPQEGLTIIRDRHTGGTGVNRSIGSTLSWLRNDRGGVLYPKAEPGKPVAEGEVVAEIRNLHGDVVEEITMPQDGYVRSYGGSQAFRTGGTQTVESGGKVASLNAFVTDEETE